MHLCATCALARCTFLLLATPAGAHAAGLDCWIFAPTLARLQCTGTTTKSVSVCICECCNVVANSLRGPTYMKTNGVYNNRVYSPCSDRV